MLKLLLFSVLLVAMIGLMIPSVDAKEYYPSINYRIEGIPTFCATDPPQDDMLASAEWLQYVETAVNYWETELKEASDYPEVWEMKFDRIQKSEMKITEEYKFSHDITEYNYEWPEHCDIGLEYYDNSRWFGVLGVFLIESDSIEIYDQWFECGLGWEGTCENYDPRDPMYDTIVHEIGHALGLGHFTFEDKEKNDRVGKGRIDFPSVMYPFQADFQPNVIITSTDIKKLQTIYGSYGFYAFSEEKPTELFADEKIIEGIPKPPGHYFLSSSVSEPKIHEVTSMYDSKFITIEGKLEPYYMKSGQKVSLQLLKPNGDSEITFITTKNNGDFQLLLQIDETFPRGIYTVSLSYLNSAFTEFDVQFEIVPKYEEIVIEKQIVDEYAIIKKSLDYEIILPSQVTLFSNSDTEVTGDLIPKNTSSKNPVGEKLYLILKQYWYGGISDTVVSSTIINEDLTFTFNLKAKDLDNILSSDIYSWSTDMKIFVGLDEIDRSDDDSELSYILITESSSSQQIPEWIPNSDTKQKVPDWVKNTAEWWASDLITETDFINAIEFLIKEKIILVDVSQTSINSQGVPDWVKNTAEWWASDLISETEFINAIEYLVQGGIIQVT